VVSLPPVAQELLLEFRNFKRSNMFAKPTAQIGVNHPVYLGQIALNILVDELCDVLRTLVEQEVPPLMLDLLLSCFPSLLLLLPLILCISLISRLLTPLRHLSHSFQQILFAQLFRRSHYVFKDLRFVPR
jgi:hypothetical protein